MVSALTLDQKICHLVKEIKWKNKRAAKGKAYEPTDIEHVANIASHGICILPSMVATYVLYSKASCPIQEITTLVYGAALVLLFTVSTMFHSVCFCQCHKYKDKLHRCDRAMIYLFIASSYFPWLTLYHRHIEDTQGFSPPVLLMTMSGHALAAWVMASLGILYQQLFHERYKALETVFYVLMGVVPALPFIHADPKWGITGFEETAIGGMFYLVGIFFFKSDGRIPFAHAIWHLFVALGASTHYYAMFSYLIGRNSPTEHPIGCIAELASV